MLTIISLTVSLFALTLSILAAVLCMTNYPSLQRSANDQVRTEEVNEHRRKLCQTIYHFLAVLIPIGLFVATYWFFFLRDATTSQELLQAMAKSPPAVLVLVFASVGYCSLFLLSSYWHLYSISRAYRPPDEVRLRDKIAIYVQELDLDEPLEAPEIIDLPVMTKNSTQQEMKETAA